MQTNANNNPYRDAGGYISIGNGRYAFPMKDAEAIAYIRREARAAALEEAARVCLAMDGPAEAQRKGLGLMSDYEVACAQAGKAPKPNEACAAAIRALIGTPTEQTSPAASPSPPR